MTRAPTARGGAGPMLNDLSRHDVRIAGVAETALGEVPGETELSMMAGAAREALAEAGMTLADVDALFVDGQPKPMVATQVAGYLGLRELRLVENSELGGAVFEMFLNHVAAAIAAGRCEVALILYASRQRTKKSRTLTTAGGAETLAGQFQAPYGLPRPIGHYALVADRHMHQFGTTPRQLAEVAVAARRWAQLNPKAWDRDPLTVEDVVTSKPIALPLRRRDVCLVTDGGGAVVVTTAERARSAARPAVRVIGAGESISHYLIADMEDLVVSPARVSGREAFAMAGITPADVDVLEPYDSFTITVLMALEDLGFCAKGEGGSFVEGGRLAPGGGLPAMTSGGGLSYCHPGQLGLLLIVEAVRQLRGEAGERQVDDAKIAVAHGSGGFFSTAGTVVMARD